MREPANRQLKAWAKEYEEAPFCFEQDFDGGSRLVAWAEETEMVKAAFYRVLRSMSETVSVKLRICAAKAEDQKPRWLIYEGDVNRQQAETIFHQHENYVFADGMNQLWLRDLSARRYLVFDDHSVFYLYFPRPEDDAVFRSIGFQDRFADPIFSQPHFHCTESCSEGMEMEFVQALGLKFVTAVAE